MSTESEIGTFRFRTFAESSTSTWSWASSVFKMRDQFYKLHYRLVENLNMFQGLGSWKFLNSINMLKTVLKLLIDYSLNCQYEQ